MMWAANDKLPCHIAICGPTATPQSPPHVANKANFALVAKVDLASLREWGRRRGWTKIRLLSSHDKLSIKIS